MFYKIKKDIEYIMENDPAARTKLEVFCYIHRYTLD